MSDGNHHIVPIWFSHAVSTESKEAWGRILSTLAQLPSFDVDGRVTIVDQERRIDK